MAEKKKAVVRRGAVGVTDDVRKQVRQLQAKIQLASGERVSTSDAIGAAVKAALAAK